jgi:Flp pilus assembly protein CpaB
VRRQTLALVIVGVLLFIAGGGIAYVTVVHGAKNRSLTPSAVAPVNQPALVATADIPAGTTGQEMVAKGLVAVQLIPQKKYVSTDLPSLAGLTDQALTTSLVKGEAIQSTELTASTSAIALPTGQDGISITTTGVAGLAGYLQPGTNVDIYANINKLSTTQGVSPAPVPAGATLPCTELVMADAEVLDVSQVVPPLANQTSASSASSTTSSSGRTIPPTITILLSVSPSQAQEITFMAQNETLSVAQTQKGTAPPAAGVCVGTGQFTTAP